MKKQTDHLWAEITSFHNLCMAFKKAARGKRGKSSVAAFEYDLEPNLIEIQQQLRNGTYQPGKYDSFYIHDPKKRLISAAPFRDRVVHHALCNVIEPKFERKFIFDSYANRAGKGTHRALDRCTTYLRRFKYVLPVDVRQFFPSIDHSVLSAILAKTIQDASALDLCAKILSSGEGVLTSEYTLAYFPGDDLLAALRPRGLPIGNLTSQFWANVYLNEFDHFIKRSLHCQGYLRYVDDFLLFADDKSILQQWREQVIAYLAGLRLVIHENSTQPRPSACGVPFLGFQVFPDHRRLKRQKVVHIRRKIKCLHQEYLAGKKAYPQVNASIQGWINHARYGDTWGLRRSILKPILL